MGFIPAQTIQKFLTINADLIQNQAFRFCSERGEVPVADNFVLLSTEIPEKQLRGRAKIPGFARDDLNDKECQKISIAQRNLLDSNNPPNYRIFNELFGPISEVPHKNKYANLLIKHKLIIPILINKNEQLEEKKENLLVSIEKAGRAARRKTGNKNFSFEEVLAPDEFKALQNTYKELNDINSAIINNSESFNYELVLEDINNKQLFFDHISIVNKSKDSFTATSNYQVSIKILFDNINSLLESSVIATCLDPTVPEKHKIKKIPLLKILHAYIDSDISNLLSNAVDLSKGIILVQECFLDGNTAVNFFPKVKVGEDYSQFNREAFSEIFEEYEKNTYNLFSNNQFKYPYSSAFYTRLGKPFEQTEEEKQAKVDTIRQIYGLTKSYHLTYHKHDFTVFKDKDAVLSELKNSITIDFVSFEADTSTNKQKSLATAPPITSNLYQLLDTASASALFKDTKAFSGRLSTLSKALQNIQEASNKIGAINEAVNLYNKYQEILNSKDAELIKEINKEFSDGGKFRDVRNVIYKDSEGKSVSLGGRPVRLNENDTYAQSIEDLKKNIETFNNDIKNIKNSINKALVFYILETSRRYSLLVPYKYLQTYDELTTFEAFKKKLSLTSLFTSYTTATGLASAAGSAAASSAGVTATIGTGLAAAGATLGIAAAVGVAGLALNEAITAEDIKGTDFIANKIREPLFEIFSTGSNVVIDDNFRSFFASTNSTRAERQFKVSMVPIVLDKEKNGTTFYSGSYALPFHLAASSVSPVTGNRDVSRRYGINQNSSPEELQKAILDYGQIPVLEKGDNVDSVIDLKFIFFGDLVSLLLRAEEQFTESFNRNKRGRTKIFMGGKIINDTARNKKTFLNFYFFPISLQALTNFLNDKILNSENLSYSTELFIKEIFENIVKGSITSVDAPDKSQNLFIPSSFKNAVINCFYDDSDQNDFYNKFFRKVGKDFDYTARHVNMLKETVTDANDERDLITFSRFLADFSFSKNLSRNPKEENLCKVFCFYSDDEVSGVNFYEEFEESDEYLKANPKPGWNSPEFTAFLNKQYGLKTIIVDFPTLLNYTITYGAPTLNFSRVDNANLTTGNLLASNAIFRYPYSFSCDSLLGYMNFFMGVGSMFFITPPVINTDALGKQQARQLDQKIPNTFGFGGLYVVKSTTFTSIPFFKKADGSAATTPQEKYKFSIEALHVGYGDGGTNLQDVTKIPKEKSPIENAFEFLDSVKGKIKK